MLMPKNRIFVKTVTMAAKNYILLLAGLLFISTSSFSQKGKPLTPEAEKVAKKDGNAAFNAGDYTSSLESYLQLLKGSPDHVDYNYKIGVSYNNTWIDRTAGIQYLEKIKDYKDAPKDTYYELGRAYHFANQFEDAISAYQKYREINGTKVNSNLNRLIEMCENGKFHIKNPVNIKFENLGKLINSADQEYNPMISGDESVLLFTTRRKGNLGGMVDASGVNTSDIFWSQMVEGLRAKAKNIGAMVNSANDDLIVYLSPDGKTLILYGDDNTPAGDLFIAEMKGKSFLKPESIAGMVNTKDDESAGCLSPDGMSIYFASNTKGGNGGLDLYTAKRLPTGGFGTPENMGALLNSSEDEDAPFISPDGKTLYFASKGFDSMGGYDIFKSEWDENNSTWSKPENMGYPFNDANDNFSASFSADGKSAYTALLRPEGLGMLDIYKVEFPDVTVNESLMVYRITLNKPFDGPLIAMATVTTKEDKIVGTYTCHPNTGRISIAVPKGSYKIKLTSPGFTDYDEELVVPQLDGTKEKSKFIIMNLDQGQE